MGITDEQEPNRLWKVVNSGIMIHHDGIRTVVIKQKRRPL